MAEICPNCGLPQELCVCEEIAREAQIIRVYTVKRTYGKVVTIVEGMDPQDINMDELARKLKTICASGGTVKNGRIELQGNHKAKVEATLAQMNFKVEME